MDKPIDQYKPIEKLELKGIKETSPKLFKPIHCPSCAKAVIADNLNLQNNMAKCGDCHVIFSFKDEVDSVQIVKEMKHEYFRPEGIDLFYYKDEMDITLDQHIQGFDFYGLLIVPVVAFFALMIYFFSDKNISVTVPIISTLGSLYFIYKALNYSKNKTHITINDRCFTIQSRPRNFKKDRIYEADEIDQLYLKHSSEMPGWYNIHMVINGLEGQKHEKLLTVNSLSKAKYLEQEIERYLHIEDRKVPEATA